MKTTIRVIDKELLAEALDKAVKADPEGWANQTGLEIEPFVESMMAFAVGQIQENPVLLVFMDEDKLTWMISAFSAAFQMGWIARTLQQEEKQ